MQVCNCFFLTAVTIMLLRLLVFIVCFFLLFWILLWTFNFCFESAFVLLFNKFLEIFLFIFCCLNVCVIFLLFKCFIWSSVCCGTFAIACFACFHCFWFLFYLFISNACLLAFFLFSCRCVCVYVFIFFLFFCYVVVVLRGMGEVFEKLFQLRMYAFVKSEIIRDHCTGWRATVVEKGRNLSAFRLQMDSRIGSLLTIFHLDSCVWVCS